MRKPTATLVTHHVAITSMMAVFEGASRPPMNLLIVKRWRELMNPQAWSHAMTERAQEMPVEELFLTLLKKEMKFEHDFVAAGGMLLAGSDPTGNGQTFAGLGNQREIELLVEAGFTPVEATHIAT